MTKETEMTNQTRNPGAWRWGLAAGVLALAGALQGCGGGGGGTVCGDGQIQAAWTLSQNGTAVECVSGDTVTIKVDTDAMTMSFNCSDHVGTTPLIVGGVTHDVALQLTDANGTVLSQTGTMSLFVPCGTLTPTPNVDFAL